MLGDDDQRGWSRPFDVELDTTKAIVGDVQREPSTGGYGHAPVGDHDLALRRAADGVDGFVRLKTPENGMVRIVQLVQLGLHVDLRLGAKTSLARAVSSRNRSSARQGEIGEFLEG